MCQYSNAYLLKFELIWLTMYKLNKFTNPKSSLYQIGSSKKHQLCILIWNAEYQFIKKHCLKNENVYLIKTISIYVIYTVLKVSVHT